MRLLGQHQANAVVAFGKKGERTKSEMLRDVAKVAAALPQGNGTNECLLCFRNDRYEFAVALLATWHVGLRAVLPPSLQVDVVARLLESQRRAALLHDTQVAGHLLVSELLKQADPGPPSELSEPRGIAASVLTSGSSGQSQVWDKTFGQLVSEVEAWKKLFFGSDPPRVVATVQPGHLYGLLFSVLYPLSSGGSFCRDIPFAPEAILDSVSRFSADTLVTVPVHLRSTEALPSGSLSRLVQVVSSTAPLHQADAQKFRQAHGVEITEIFGSTETGGIAYRRRGQQAAGEHGQWLPLPGVRIDVSSAGRMVVDSPFASEGLPRPYETRDRIELHPSQGFVQLGRDDSVVKIGGQRVHYLEQEGWLLEQPEVSDAAILDIPDLARGTRLLALVAAEESVQAELRRRMAERFGTSVIPKRFVMVHELPRGPNGKLGRRDALSLFKLSDRGEPLSEQVDIKSLQGAGEDHGELRAQLVIPDDFVWFQGHFSGYPVMAGVVQLLAVVMPTARRVWPWLGEIAKMESVKFTGRIEPGDELDLAFQLEEGALRGAFSISRSGQTLTAGKLRFFDPYASERGAGKGISA